MLAHKIYSRSHYTIEGKKKNQLIDKSQLKNHINLKTQDPRGSFYIQKIIFLGGIPWKKSKSRDQASHMRSGASRRSNHT